MMHRVVRVIFALLVLTSPLLAEDRVERFPAPDFRISGHKMPQLVTSPSAWLGWYTVDVIVLAAFLSAASYLVLKKRSRRATFYLTIAAVLYFGFWRKGCICPVGSIQNVSEAAGMGAALPWAVALFFLLPLVFALFFGRVFCSGVCPLGAIQDLVLYKPVHVPNWLELSLGLLAWAYLGLGVLFAATGSDYFICRYDPFVGFFRRSGPSHMILAGGIILATSMFIGRLYCRFLCPYSVLLRMLSVFSYKKVTITPTDCIDCRLCEKSCPFGAIRFPSPKEQPRPSAGQKRELVFAMSLLPVLVIVLAAIGYLGRGALARMNTTVQLAEEVWAEQQQGKKATSDTTRAFWGAGQSAPQLFNQAAAIQRRFAVGAPLFGAWMGLAIGGRLVGVLVRKRRSGYTADPAACVACARCFPTCPVETEQKHQQQEESLAVV